MLMSYLEAAEESVFFVRDEASNAYFGSIRASFNSARWGMERTIPLRFMAKWKWQLEWKTLPFLIC